MSTQLDLKIAEVVRSGNCTGCGACCLLDDGLRMEISDKGYSRPERRTAPSSAPDVADFDAICPGVRVRAQRPAGSVRHPLLGSSFGSWQAWATDPEIRERGSSGGTISALVAWMLATGRVTESVGATKSPETPLRTVSLTLRTREDVMAAAGSRYAPVSNAAIALVDRPDTAFVGKPCEVTAVRALADLRGGPGPVLLSFFCAGTPSQHATDALVHQLVGEAKPVDLWYRGNGWPGEFTVIAEDGTRGTDSYDHSWGKQLGPTVQWRCKVCPDGVGESADIVAADFWETDENGYPLFAERAGVSALIARTRRGVALIEEAFQEGVIEGEPLDLDALAAVQPAQTDRRETLMARVAGARVAGRRAPKFEGFGFWRGLRGRPRMLVRIARGSHRRVRQGRADG
ncbi:MAG: Coenzyme F420 hydrogenase/dehydrogenase, beta subunit C-terminal domain [Arachnia sp.]